MKQASGSGLAGKQRSFSVRYSVFFLLKKKNSERNCFPSQNNDQPNKIILYDKNVVILGVGGASKKDFEVFEDSRHFSPILRCNFPFSKRGFHGLSLNSSSYNNGTHTSLGSPLQKPKHKSTTKELWKCLLNHGGSTLPATLLKGQAMT